jgi:hypothetical protein
MRSKLATAALACVVMLSGCSWLHRLRPHADEPRADTPAPPATEPRAEPAPPTAAAAPPSPPAVPAPSAPLQALAVDAPPNPSAHESPGNLAATHELGCLPSTQLSNEYTPADLYPAMGRCLAEGDTPRAVLLSALAGVYARFDTLRVADTTAHDAGQVLTRRATRDVGEQQRKDFAQATMGVSHNANVLAAVCDEIRRVGPPNYFPAYMIEHGMGASAANDGSIWTPDFDPQAAWQQALDGYLHCPKP